MTVDHVRKVVDHVGMLGRAAAPCLNSQMSIFSAISDRIVDFEAKVANLER